MNTDELVERARQANPVRPDAFEGLGRSPEAQETLSAILQRSAVEQTVTAPTATSTASSKPRPRLGVGFAAGAAVLVAAVIAITTIVPDRGERRTAHPTDPLGSASLVAAQDDRVVIGDGEYIYLHLKGQGTGTMDVADRSMTALIPTETEIWVANDHTGRVVTTTGEPEFLSEGDRLRWEAAGRPEFSKVGTEDRSFEAGELFAAVDLDSYPTDPDALYATLLDEARAARSGEQERHEYVFTLTSDLLFRFPEASPDLRSALFEVLGTVPGTQAREDVRDPADRPSAVVSLTVSEDENARRRHDLFFDPHTAQVVGFQEIFISRSGDESLRSNAVLLDSGVVNSKQSRP